MRYSFDFFWAAVKHLWTKFCGLSDEYRMLKMRWKYLEGHLMTLPSLENGFRLVDRFVENTERLFRVEMFLDRGTPEELSRFREVFTGEIKRDENGSISLEGRGFDLPIAYVLMQERVEDLSFLVGILKAALFQRSTSVEISHLLPGEPFSIDRSIGYELVYLAGDKVAQSVVSLLDFKNIKWDGVITFSPMKTFMSGRGGFYYPLKSIGLFHVTLDEKEKYGISSLMIIPHEIAHAFLDDLSWRGMNDPKWREKKELIRIISDKILKFYKDLDEYLTYPSKMTYVSRHIAEEILADFLAYELSGGAYLSYVFDSLALGSLVRVVRHYPIREFVPREDSLMRLAALETILLESESISKEYKEMATRLLQHTVASFVREIASIEGVDKSRVSRLLTEAYSRGETIGEILAGGPGERFLNEVLSDKVREYLANLYEPSSIERIQRKLEEGEIVVGEHPLKILNGYYWSYIGGDGRKPGYMAALLSIIHGHLAERPAVLKRG